MLSTDRFAPTAIRVDLGAIFVSLELSRSRWLATSLSPGAGEKMSRHQLAGGDLGALVTLLEQLRAKARARTGQDYGIVCIQEAGLDGFWLHRALEAEGVESWVVDPASVAVNRRKRRAKSDRIDGDGLLRTLMAFKRGEPRVCSMVRPPSPQAEDRRQPTRERQRLMTERTQHANRIKGLLFAQGIGDYDPLLKRRRKALEALRTGDGRALPDQLKRQLLRELDRLELVLEQLQAVESERDGLLAPAQPEAGSCAKTPGAALMRLKGIAEERAAVIGSELLWRSFENRRQVGAYAGLAASPFKSGKIDQEQGLSKAGNKRLRHTMIELAWGWLLHQPQSELSLWFRNRLGPKPDRKRKKILIAALARKLLIALWRLETQASSPKAPCSRPSEPLPLRRGLISPVDPGGRTDLPPGLSRPWWRWVPPS
jgi:transposase